MNRLPLAATGRVPVALLLGLSLAVLGCAPAIGDPCSTSTDCSQTGDRLCDISQPGGYCTMFDCEPGGSNAATKCPDEAACIAFAAEPSAVPGCENRLGATPYERSFCMKKCDNQNDCRKDAGYICVDLAVLGPAWVDLDGPTKVCTQPYSAVRLPENRDAGVCTETSPDLGAGGASDASGAGGAPQADAGMGGA
jgi:hypothetical protein